MLVDNTALLAGLFCCAGTCRLIEEKYLLLNKNTAPVSTTYICSAAVHCTKY
jgi:hypothetical protein